MQICNIHFYLWIFLHFLHFTNLFLTLGLRRPSHVVAKYAFHGCASGGVCRPHVTAMIICRFMSARVFETRSPAFMLVAGPLDVVCSSHRTSAACFSSILRTTGGRIFVTSYSKVGLAGSFCAEWFGVSFLVRRRRFGRGASLALYLVFLKMYVFRILSHRMWNVELQCTSSQLAGEPVALQTP